MLLGFIIIPLIASWAFFTWRMAKSKPEAVKNSFVHFFLPKRLFVSLIFLVTFWLILLILLGSLELSIHEQPVVIITLSLFAPFFCFFCRKRMEEGR